MAAAGAPVSEEDLIFYTLHGLPSEFDGLQTTISTRLGEITFEELITLINGEEMRKNKSPGVNASASTSVFVATTQQNPLTTTTSSHVPQQKFQSQFENQSHNFHQVVPQQQQPSMFVSPYPHQFNNFRNQNISRRFRNQKNGSRAPCQICDRTNHTAKDCYYRLNLQYSSPSYSSSVPSSPIPQAHMLQSPSPTHYQPPGVSQTYSSSVNAGLLPTP